MTRMAIGYYMALALGVATLGAQATNPAQSAQTPSSGQEVKVTGCLGKDDTGGFTLTNAKVEPPRTGTIAESLQTATTFKLQGSGLDSHISEMVEITGSATAPSTPTAPAASDAPAPGGGRRGRGGPPDTSTNPRLDVKSAKRIHGYPCF